MFIETVAIRPNREPIRANRERRGDEEEGEREREREREKREREREREREKERERRRERASGRTHGRTKERTNDLARVAALSQSAQTNSGTDTRSFLWFGLFQVVVVRPPKAETK